MERTRGSNSPELKIESSKVSLINGEIKIQLNLSVKTLTVGGPTNLQQSNIIYSNNKKNTLLEVKTDPPTVKEKDERIKDFMPLAKRLYHVIKIKKNIKYSATQIKSWADEIRRLTERNGISYERIKTVLDWYTDNILGEYVPVIESGYSLRKKFLRLEESMKRDLEPSKEVKIRIIDGKSYTKDKKGVWRNSAGEWLEE